MDVARLIEEAQAIGTSIASRPEVTAALAKAARVGMITREVASSAVQVFNSDWQHLIRVQCGEPVAARAAALAWEHGLRGYDAVHLATALIWHDALRETITLATYDRQLWRSAQASGLTPWPSRMP
jgi:uncharacterized protein